MRIFFFVALLLASTSIFAQKTWTIKECVDYAIAHNINIGKSELTKTLAENELSRSKHALLPAFNAYSSYSNTAEIPVTSNHPSTEYTNNAAIGLSLDVDLFKGLFNYNTIKKNKLLLQASDYTIESNKKEIMLQVGTAFMYMLFSKEKLNTLEIQIRRSIQELEAAQKRFNAGESSDADVLKMQIQLAHEELQKSTIENELNDWKLALAQAMEVRIDTISDIALGMEFPFEKLQESISSLDSLYTKACSTNPEILGANAFIESKDYDIALAKSYALPSLSLSYNAYTNFNKPGNTLYYSSPYSEEVFFENIYGVFSAQLRIPIFNKFTVKHSIAAQKIHKQEAEFALLDAKKNIYNGIATAYYDMEAARNEYEKQSSILELTKKSYSYSEKQNQAGDISTTDFLLEKNNLNSAEVNILVSRYTFLFHKMIVEFYVTNQINF